MKSKYFNSVKFFLILFTCFAVFLPEQVFSSEKSVARLTEFSGTVLIKSQGSWGLEPKKDFQLYSKDKVVTRKGNATVVFNDGAIIKLNDNSNMLIMEKEEEKGFFRKVMFNKRSLRLLVGKLSFVTGKIGKIKTETTFETATAVCGIRGTSGILSIAVDNQNYLKFIEGEAKFIVGKFITGVAEPVPSKIADAHPAQRVVFKAKAAAVKAVKASIQVKTGEISKAQGDLIKAFAEEAAGREVKIQATIVAQNNPDKGVVAQAQASIVRAEKLIENAKSTQQEAIKSGAVPKAEPKVKPEAKPKVKPKAKPEDAEPYEPEDPGLKTPVDKEPRIQDTKAGSPT